jgi:hypothetical protein
LATLAPEDRPLLTADFQEDESATSARACRGPVIQSDHGSGFIAREFAETLAGAEVGHRRIRPHTPTDNAEIERYQRTIGERIDEHDLEDYDQAQGVIGGIIDHYNHHRLHSSLNFLRPVDYYRGNPEALLAERRRKLVTARELRKQENLKLRQRLLPYPAAPTVSYSERRFVSLRVKHFTLARSASKSCRIPLTCSGVRLSSCGSDTCSAGGNGGFASLAATFSVDLSTWDVDNSLPPGNLIFATRRMRALMSSRNIRSKTTATTAAIACGERATLQYSRTSLAVSILETSASTPAPKSS